MLLSTKLETALGNAYAKKDAAGRIMCRAGENEYLKEWFRQEHLIAIGEQTGLIESINLIYSDDEKRSMFDSAEKWGYEHEVETFEYLVSNYKQYDKLTCDEEWTFDLAFDDMKKHIDIMTA